MRYWKRMTGRSGREDRLVHCAHPQGGLPTTYPHVRRDQPNVVQNPDAAAVRPRDHVVVARVDLDVVDGHGRHARAQTAPPGAAVGRREDAIFGPGDQDVGVLVMLPDHVHGGTAQPVPNRPPRRPEVLGHQDVRLVVVVPVPVEADVRALRLMVRRLDPAHVVREGRPAPRAHDPLRHVGPRSPPRRGSPARSRRRPRSTGCPQ